MDGPCSFFLRFIMVLLVSINSQGLRSSDRRKLAFQFLNRNRFDVVCLQETHWSVDLEMQIKREWNGDIFFAHGTDNARGVSILIHSRLDHTIQQVKCDNEGRIVNILLSIEDRTLNIVNIYAPNQDCERRAFFSGLDRFISNSYENIVAGDFNCVMDMKLDKYGGDPKARNSAACFLQAINARFDLCDIWRKRHRNERNFTWTGKNTWDNSLIRTRIDFFLASKTLDPFVSGTHIGPYPYSDHDYTSLLLDLDQVVRGPGFWHFNNELLKDIAFQAEIEKFWMKWDQEFRSFTDPLRWWDQAKLHFKRIAIRHAKLKRKNQHHERFLLQNRVEKLHARATNGTTQDIEQYLLAREELKKLDLKELEATKIRAKAQFEEEGEKSTRYFFSLEKCRRAEQCIRILTKDNLDTISETKDLLAETHSFYKSLFSAQPCDENVQANFLSGCYPNLSEEACASCEGMLTNEELKKAVYSMENDKSPGIDGLTTNFYKQFWPILGDKLTSVCNHAFHAGHLSITQRRGIITLIFKKGDRSLLKNWRPITLLTTDYKILTKALANRLQRVLPSIIHTDQTASVRGRTINDNTRLLHDVISYANERNVPLAVISVDQMKAFDRVSHAFLFKTLQKFGFGPNFTQWIRLIYTSVSSSVKTNGWLSAFIQLERGLRQGCPLSMPLYVLTAETMAINIRSNPRIHGIKPPGSQAEAKLSQFADDTTLLLTDEQSITETFHVFDLYERASGAKINKNKCKGLWSGSLSYRTDQIYGFDWFNDFIPEKVLGQFFGNVNCTTMNWNVKVQKINNIIAAWKHRDISYKGRALIINALLTSTLWYNVTSLAVPPWAIAQIEQSIYGFFWDNKHPLVNRDILALPVKEGGFNIPRLESKVQAFRLNTLRRLLSEGEAHWKNFTAYFLRVSNMRVGKLSLALTFPLQCIDPTIPAFHKELLSAWQKFRPCRIRNQTPTTVTDILKEPLFLNKQITISDEPLLYRNWIAAGITNICDVCYEVIPNLLPVHAIHEILSDVDENCTLESVTRDFNRLLSAVPKEWIKQICSEQIRPAPSNQPYFAIRSSTPGKIPEDIQMCKTRHFYHLIHELRKPSVPAIDHWKSLLQPIPIFDANRWINIYSPLVNNKQGDINWKIVHRVLPTGLSLNRMGILHSANCHRCGAIDNIEHALLECGAVRTFWIHVDHLISKISANKVSLTPEFKMLGIIHRNELDKKTLDLINWVLTIARYSIHKANVHHRIHNITLPIEAIFAAEVKAHVKYKYKLYRTRLMQENFANDWCIGNALAKIVNGSLVFNF